MSSLTSAPAEVKLHARMNRPLIQRKTAGITPAVHVPPLIHEVLRYPGRPLDHATRAFYEPRFGQDFSAVRVHTDTRAAESARSVNALAYTVGHDIVFDTGQYTPTISAGKQLLAHELTHVMQQSGQQASTLQTLSVGPADDGYEREARALAQVAVSGSSDTALTPTIVPMKAASPRIQREPRFSEDCSSFNRCNVIEPLVHSKQMVDAAITALPPIAAGTVTSGRIIDVLNVHFHNPSAPAATAAAVLVKLQAIRTELDAPIRYVCHPDSPGDCEVTATGFVGGFTTCSSGSDIHLCSLYHVSLTCEEQARVLVHEAAHHVPDLCPDHAYVGQAEYMALPPDKALQNPDTYAQFSKMVFMGAPSCIDCGAEIQRRGGKRY